VGEQVALTIAGRESTWTVVGLLASTAAYGPDATCFVPFEALAQETGHSERGNTVFVVAAAHDRATRDRLIADLGDVYAAQHIETTGLSSVDELQDTLFRSFDTLSYALWAMGVLAGAVGSMGLAGTLSISVIERRREVGLMRAVGALPGNVFGIFIAEGICLGVLSWALAVAASIPGARIFSSVIGRVSFGAAYDFAYAYHSVVIWFVLVVALSAVSSLGAAWRAARVSAREALSYE
jgi:putative ABC transport system permease protein